MDAMTQLVSMPSGRPFTVADLEAMPDDGNRYELIDGVLIVSPTPSWEHQEMSATLYVALRDACPRSMRVIIAPFAVQTAYDSEVQPDVLVARYSDMRSKHLPVAPLLVVETLSRSTALLDRNTKKAHYARMGVPSYWLLDPTEPGALTVFALQGMEADEGGGVGTSLRDGEYVEIAHVVGDEEFVAVEPFPVTVVPARLLDGTRP